MTSPRDEHDLVLEAASPTTLALAEQVLADAGIPSLRHGPDFDAARQGAAHGFLRPQDLYVPRGAGERARELLRETLDI